MAVVSNINKVIAALKKLKVEAGKSTSAAIGFTQRYAVHVHEDMAAAHAPGKQAKYLEAPARQYATEIATAIRTVYSKTKNLEKALIMGGLRLQREAQQIVPIDTSALKNSAWTALEKEVVAVSAAAFAKSEAIRITELTKRANKP